MATPEDLKRARAAMEGDAQRRTREAAEQRARAAKAELEAELATTSAAKAQEEEKILTAREAQAKQVAAQTAAQEQRVKNAARAERIVGELKTKKLDISPIRTFKSDMARAVKEEGISIAKIAITQQARNRLSGQEQDVNLKPKKSHALPVLLILLLIVAAGGAGYWWWQNHDTTVAPAPSVVSSIIAAESSSEIDVSGLDAVAIRQKIYEQFAPSEPTDWTIKSLEFASDGIPLNLAGVLQTTNIRMPDRLSRNLSESHLLGVYNNGEVKLPFLILTTKFYDQAYAGLLEWEASMASDLLPVLRPEPVAPAELNPPFKDKLVRNKNVRLLTNKQGHTLLFYTFLDRQTIAITRNEETFLELFDRFTNL